MRLTMIDNDLLAPYVSRQEGANACWVLCARPAESPRECFRLCVRPRPVPACTRKE